MVSSFGLHYRNERTLRELMRIYPDEHPVSIQLFGHDAEVMRSGAAVAAEAGADLIDINMGCPVRKVRRTGAGLSCCATTSWRWPGRGATEGSGLPVTVKLRSGIEAGDRSGYELAFGWSRRRASRRSHFTRGRRQSGTRAAPTTRSTRELAERVEVPVIVSGGLEERRGGPRRLRGVRGRRGDDRPWLARQPLGLRRTHRAAHGAAGRAEVAAELLWTIDRAEEHMGTERAGRYLRKFYPWYVERLGASPSSPTSCSATPTCPSGADRRRRARRAGRVQARPRYNPATSGPGVVTQMPPHLGVFGSRSRFPSSQPSKAR